MAIIETLDDLIDKTKKDADGFEHVAPGSLERKKYLKESIGEAQKYITDLLISLRTIRKNLLVEKNKDSV